MLATVLSADPPRHTVHAGSGIPLARDLQLECTLTPDRQGTHYRHVISYEPALGPLGRLVDVAVRPSLRRDGLAVVDGATARLWVRDAGPGVPAARYSACAGQPARCKNRSWPDFEHAWVPGKNRACQREEVAMA